MIKRFTSAAAKPSLLILIFMVSVGPFGDTEYTPSLTQIAASFNIRYSVTILTMSSYLIGLAISQIFYGPLSDRYGRRPVLLGGVGIFIVGSFLCLFSPNIGALIAARFFQAVGACSGTMISNTAVRDSFPEKIRGKMYAKINAAFAIAPGVGPVVGAYVREHFHWRMNFAILLALACLLFIAVYFFFPETNKHLNKTAAEPKQVVLNYLKLFRDPYYLAYVSILGLCIGIVYNSLTQSPDLVLNLLGLGTMGIITVTTSVMLGFIFGSILCNNLFNYLSENKIIAIGLALILISSGLMYWSVGLPDQTLKHSLIPITGAYIGIALILPMATTRAMTPFKNITGSAAAFLGFAQMLIAALATGVLSIKHTSSLYVMPTSFLTLGCTATMIYIFGIALRPNKRRKLV
jgi:MFS transporter, DHA1 family, multidrug resistance protein